MKWLLEWIVKGSFAGCSFQHGHSGVSNRTVLRWSESMTRFCHMDLKKWIFEINLGSFLQNEATFRRGFSMTLLFQHPQISTDSKFVLQSQDNDNQTRIILTQKHQAYWAHHGCFGHIQFSFCVSEQCQWTCSISCVQLADLTQKQQFY